MIFGIVPASRDGHCSAWWGWFSERSLLMSRASTYTCSQVYSAGSRAPSDFRPISWCTFCRHLIVSPSLSMPIPCGGLSRRLRSSSEFNIPCCLSGHGPAGAGVGAYGFLALGLPGHFGSRRVSCRQGFKPALTSAVQRSPFSFVSLVLSRTCVCFPGRSVRVFA